jgi:hypothetical protein
VSLPVTVPSHFAVTTTARAWVCSTSESGAFTRWRFEARHHKPLNRLRSGPMPMFDPQLIQIMRSALEEVMRRVPLEYATPATKAYLAECILKAAAQGQTSFEALVAAAADQIQAVIALFA